jgi:hypothetical protein
MNSTRTGPIEGTLPAAANRCTGVNRIIARRNNLLKFFVMNEAGRLFIFLVLGKLRSII